MLAVHTVWDTFCLPRSTHYSSAQILFPWSHRGWNKLWWSYLTSPGWPTCEGGNEKWLWDHKVSSSYRVFVDVLAVRENELGFGTARRTAGDLWAAVQLISVPYVVSICAMEHPCNPRGSKGLHQGSGRSENYAACKMYSTFIYGGGSIKGTHLTSNRKERGNSRYRGGKGVYVRWADSRFFSLSLRSPVLLELVTSGVKGSCRSEDGRLISTLFHPHCFPGK